MKSGMQFLNPRRVEDDRATAIFCNTEGWPDTGSREEAEAVWAKVLSYVWAFELEVRRKEEELWGVLQSNLVPPIREL